MLVPPHNTLFRHTGEDQYPRYLSLRTGPRLVRQSLSLLIYSIYVIFLLTVSSIYATLFTNNKGVHSQVSGRAQPLNKAPPENGASRAVSNPRTAAAGRFVAWRSKRPGERERVI
jgi:hypothetical protein